MATNSDSNSNKPAEGLKQQTFEGMGHPEVERLAVRLKNLRRERMALQEQERKLADELLGAMGKAEISVFRFEEDDERFVAKVKHGKTKVSVRKEKNEDAGDEE